MEKIAISINDTAKAIGVGRTSVYRLIREGELEVVRIGRRTLITTSSLRKRFATAWARSSSSEAV